MHDSKTLEAHGLKADEYERIKTLLGREPNLVELGMFSVMWSEHCSYKSTRIHLKKLPTKGPRVAQGPGENAGALDIGDGLLAVFKIESHNHPSFIEPYQGAATGVGGILRDIFTMGARPIAVLNSLRFSDSFDQKTRRIISGVVAGIGGYGNAFGCPTVGGEVVFEPCYAGNPLVNAFCLGMTTKDKLFLGRAEGIGNTVFYVGAKTGRDGIHGATMASSEFGEGSEEKRPTVQVGDPFMEKLLIECTLEVLHAGLVEGIQDLGAAGISCATSELAAAGDGGMYIELDKVLLRDLPQLYGIKDIQELNSLFTLLAFNTAEEVALEPLSKRSGVGKQTIQKYIEYLEAAFLIKRVFRVFFIAQWCAPERHDGIADVLVDGAAFLLDGFGH